MIELPILFSAPMVRAILSGQKTVTRRVVKVPQIPEATTEFEGSPDHAFSAVAQRHRRWGFCVFGETERAVADQLASYCPYGKPGDRLWVREAWLPDPDRDHDAWDDHHCTAYEWDGCGGKIKDVPPAMQKPEHCIYREGWSGTDLIWRPSIHMPRWASRILLEVTAVRVERLREISEEQARSEGISPLSTGRFHCGHDEEGQITSKSPVTAFAWLWGSINGEGSWAENPWVWVVEFKRVELADV